MTPRAIIDKEKRRYEDDPEYTVFRWIIGFVKLVAYGTALFFCAAGWNFMLDQRKNQSDLRSVVAESKYNNDMNNIQNLKIENHEVRIDEVEFKLKSK